jgi:hypothetical protein
LPVVTFFSGIYFFIITAADQLLTSRRFLLITILALIIIASVGFLGALPGIESDGATWFIFLQLIFLGFGIFYWWLLKEKHLGQFSNPALANPIILFLTAGLGAIGFHLIFDHFDANRLGVIYMMSILLFFIPYVFVRMGELVMAIPPEIYKIWYYDINAEDPDYDKFDLKNNIYLLELEFTKTANKDVVTNFRAKAPVDIVFGEWYRSFINNYNYKFENEPIEYLDNGNNPYGWTFYVKPATWIDNKRFIDFELSVKNNKLNEKTIIVAKRVSVQD